MVVTTDRELFAWGRGDNGRLGLGNQQSYPLPQPVGLEPGFTAKAVKCGVDCSFVLALNYRLLACGSNRCNKLALDSSQNTVEESQTFTPITARLLTADHVKAVTMGTSHAAVLTASGKCVTFGSNSFGQLGYDRAVSSREPQIVHALGNKQLTLVSCGDTFTVAVSDEGEVFSWGKGSRGRLGYQTDEDCSTPKCLSLPLKLKVLSLCSSHCSTMLCGKVL